MTLSINSTAYPIYPSESDFGSPGASSDALDRSHRNTFAVPETILESGVPTPRSSLLQLPASPQAQALSPSNRNTSLFKWPFRSPRGESASTSTVVSDAGLASAHRQHALSKLKPTNYVVLSRKNKRPRGLLPGTSSVKGTFTINPFLHIPNSLLSPFRPTKGGNDRPNFSLDVENGGIDVDIYLVGDVSSAEGHEPTQRTTLHLSLRGSHRLDSEGLWISSNHPANKFPLIAKMRTPTHFRPPFYLSAKAEKGLLSIHLPRSFHGLIKVFRHDGDIDRHVTASRELKDHLVVLGEVGTTRRYFVGEVGGWMKDKQEQELEWRGDEVELGVTSGKIRLQFVDERDFFRRVWRRAVGLL